MKKIFLFILILAIVTAGFTGCSSKASSNKKEATYDISKTIDDSVTVNVTEAKQDDSYYTIVSKDDGSSEIIYFNPIEDAPMQANTVPHERKYEQEIVICDFSCTPGYSTGYFDYDKLSDNLKIDCTPAIIDPENMQLKLMAGDSDVDIYIIGADTGTLLLNSSIYSLIDSETIDKYNESCFDCISEFTKDKNGDTFLMPVNASIDGFVYSDPIANEAGFKRQDILYYDSMMSFLKNYNGSRKAYSNGTRIFSCMEKQYEHFYCDFADKKADYMTDTYKKIYSTLEGWQRNSQSPAPKLFANDATINIAYAEDLDKVLFINLTSGGVYQSLYNAIKNEQSTLSFGVTSDITILTTDEFGKLRMVPNPKIDESIDKNQIGCSFALINPNSKNKENALKVLEEIANNYFDYADYFVTNQISFLFKDKSLYPDYYLPDSQLFADIYDNIKDGYLVNYNIFTFHNDIEEFQNGRATLEEAIAMYQREVNIWLNE